MTAESVFSDVLAANESFAEAHDFSGLAGHAAKGLAIVTCIDSRIEPLILLGLKPGDAKILRNAGGRVTDDVLRTLVLARYLLSVDRVMVVQHTDCRMAVDSEEQLHSLIEESGGPDTRALTFQVDRDQRAAIRSDLERLRSFALLPDLRVGGFLYDLRTGLLQQID